MIRCFVTGTRQVLKNVATAIALIIAAPAAATTLLDRLIGSDEIFNFWAHVCALAPGLPGMYVRRAFYQWTLDECAADCFIGFGAVFTRRQVHVEDGAYVGPYALVGAASLRRGCLIGSRTSIVSGRNMHELQPDGTWGPSRVTTLRPIDVGEFSWIGEANTIMADIGRGALVAAGSVVSSAVPPGVMVAGNPARFVRVLQPPASVAASAGAELRGRPASAPLEKVYAGGLRPVD